MKIFKILLTILLIVSVSQINAQKRIEFFPGSLNIKPFTANTLEPNLGFLFKVNSNELILNIGNSMDLVHYKSWNSILSAGADLFTWTLLRKEANFHFPVDAVDYMFGLNFGYKKILGNFTFGIRARLSHISAHFVDGHYDGTLSSWRGGIYPRVYSREFIELTPFVKYKRLRVYAGFTYLYHVDPLTIQKDNYQVGFDYFFGKRLFKYFSVFIGYDLNIVHFDKYFGNNSITAGIKFGKPEGRGLSLQFHYYSGKSIHGEYFDFYEQYSSIGLNLDL